mmetsp:Transcript_55330/g.155691  ORF Transcript_55330/g.155691 Transcript_55330/m.155691 type:complete len:201 (-) Transcript_55330:52-654(-)
MSFLLPTAVETQPNSGPSPSISSYLSRKPLVTSSRALTFAPVFSRVPYIVESVSSSLRTTMPPALPPPTTTQRMSSSLPAPCGFGGAAEAFAAGAFAVAGAFASPAAGAFSAAFASSCFRRRPMRSTNVLSVYVSFGAGTSLYCQPSKSTPGVQPRARTMASRSSGVASGLPPVQSRGSARRSPSARALANHSASSASSL